MKLKEIVETLEFTVLTGEDRLDREVTGGYAGDLLSDVLANAEEGDIWMTIQIHQNTIPVAVMKGLAAIVIVNGKTPDELTLAKADEEGVPILGTPLNAYQVSGRLYGVGLKP